MFPCRFCDCHCFRTCCCLHFASSLLALATASHFLPLPLFLSHFICFVCAACRPGLTVDASPSCAVPCRACSGVSRLVRGRGVAFLPCPSWPCPQVPVLASLPLALARALLFVSS